LTLLRLSSELLGVYLLLGALGAIAGAGLGALLDGSAVEGTTDDLVADTGEVLDTAATEQNHGVLLEVVALTRDVSGDFHAVDQADTADLTKSRIRLLGGGGENAGANATLLGIALQCRGLLLLNRPDTALADQLIDGRQNFNSF
jgi:hypothetical protein